MFVAVHEALQVKIVAAREGNPDLSANFVLANDAYFV
jgi:hypothetical protein